jgi:tetratricopeptide (TPR) repeat protein
MAREMPLDKRAPRGRAARSAEIRANARGWLERAGERAISLVATEEAQRAFEGAAELAAEPAICARLLERAADMARTGNLMQPSTRDLAMLDASIELARLASLRGQGTESGDHLARVVRPDAGPEDRQWAASLLAHDRVAHVVDGHFVRALDVIEEEVANQIESREQDLVIAIALRDAATIVPLAEDRSSAERTLAAVEREFSEGAPRSVTAQMARLHGVLATTRGDYNRAVEDFRVALAPARSLGYVPWVAEVLVDYATALVADDRREDAEPLIREARDIAEPLRWARPLDRIATIAAGSPREEALTQ